MAILECKEIKKSFGAVTALKGVTLEVKQGEVRALFGGNGSGKSTLAKILGGFVELNAGEIRIDGKMVKCSSPSQAKKCGIVVTAQELSLFSNLSVSQNLTLADIPTKMGVVDKKAVRAMAFDVLKKVHLSKLIDDPVDSLSLNQKYMLELAKALLQKPRILILDEITSALYREEVLIVKEIVEELKSEGCAVIFVSHRMPEIYAICDTITVLRNGAVVGTYDVASKSKNELLSLMTGRTITDTEVVEHRVYTQESESILSVKNLKLLNKNNTVDLDVYKGEIVGVAGLQGNGQSELVRTLFAINDSIDMKVKGRDCKIRNPQNAVENGIAFISGERELEGTFPNRSIAENLTVATELVLHRKTSKGQIENVLQRYHVVMDSQEQQIQTLSGGNQQKVVMARWTMIEPMLILADDPTKGIDVNARRDVHNLLKELTEKGSAVIFVSSDDEELVELTRSVPYSRVIIMYDGRIVSTLYGNDITTENIAANSIPGEGRAE